MYLGTALERVEQLLEEPPSPLERAEEVDRALIPCASLNM